MIGDRQHLRNPARLFIAAVLLAQAVQPGQARAGDFGAEEMLFSEIPFALGSLTQESPDKSPVAVTVITEEQIRMTPARNLYDVLEVYVPGFQHVTHFDATHMGLRGIQANRDWAFIMLVNGVPLDQKSHSGPTAELENWDMNDIAKVEVVRGPGSVTYGPGAVAGVINITTKDGASSPGFSAGVNAVSGYRSGGGYASASFDAGSGKGYIYGSVQKTAGLKSPDVYAMATPVNPGLSGYMGGDTIHYYNDHRDRPQHKFHFQLEHGDWKHWLRYSNSGTNRFVTWENTGGNWFLNSNGGTANRPQTGTRQYVAATENHKVFSGVTSLRTTLSWSSQDIERLDLNRTPGVHQYVLNYAENNLSFKSILRHDLGETWKTALGVEYNYYNIGKGWGDVDDEFIIDDGFIVVDSPAYNDDPNRERNWIGTSNQIYSTSIDMDTYGFFGEVNKSVTPDFDVMLSARADKARYADWYFSPRLSAIYNAHDAGLFKASVQRSIRGATPLQLYANHAFKQLKPSPEKFDGAEVSYERRGSRMKGAVTAFYSAVELLGWQATGGNVPGSTRGTAPDGNLRMAGVELEAEYKSPEEKVTVGLNHTFIKQVGFKLDGANTRSDFSHSADAGGLDYTGSIPLNGVGSDRMNWANHRTKISSTQKVSNRLKLFQSVRAAWGYEGQKNWLTMLQNGGQAVGGATQATIDAAVEDAHRNHLFGIDVRVDLSAQYQVSEPLSVTLLGQNVVRATRQYRYMYTMVSAAAVEEPTTVAMRLDYKFR
jgi:outer membrane receptor protein involved in Fe transport